MTKRSNVGEKTLSFSQGNGIIDFREFLHLMDTRMKGIDTEAEIREMFKVFDMDGNGFISSEEFKWTMMNLGQQLTEEEVEEIIKTADLNGDGQIDLEGDLLICLNLMGFASWIFLACSCLE